ncbi:MarR family winged helix-turn-helix transcriptional regulator [Phycobacter azelaicus]|jgi:DNA-binding MarR family transcriptional regulator|uniref:MarR family winged helix-turn-helix transcriptional regulator n=1 Tax=Phycobacter azelaicus TaxID=2668075 RepID=UPI00186715A5|nr:MarR family winged helix-turn-helix transcriptional regulator [Phycobacter azelaicus]MBE1296121.1 MarR family transcriptional regulator [Paracoccaceae bacterium]
MSDLTDDMFLILPDGSDVSPAAPTLDFTRSPVVTVTFAGNRLTRNAARAYQQEFGVGVMEWRMLVMLTRDPGCSVGHAARTTGIDKAAVSRALQRMEQAGLARAEVLGGDERRKSWLLTDAGHALHARMLPRALERQRALLKGFSPDELASFTGYLQRFLANMSEDSE